MPPSRPPRRAASKPRSGFSWVLDARSRPGQATIPGPAFEPANRAVRAVVVAVTRPAIVVPAPPARHHARGERLPDQGRDDRGPRAVASHDQHGQQHDQSDNGTAGVLCSHDSAPPPLARLGHQPDDAEYLPPRRLGQVRPRRHDDCQGRVVARAGFSRHGGGFVSECARSGATGPPSFDATRCVVGSYVVTFEPAILHIASPDVTRSYVGAFFVGVEGAECRGHPGDTF